MLCLDGAQLHLYGRATGLRRPRGRGAGRAAAILVVPLLALAACQLPAEFGGTAASTTPSAEALTPIAGSGAALAAGAAADPMRVQRSYFAASGRECREVVLGAGVGERATLLCQDGAGGWAPARPLLRGGGGVGSYTAGIARP
jgi:17 kDa common-antigen outer membrane protein